MPIVPKDAPYRKRIDGVNSPQGIHVGQDAAWKRTAGTLEIMAEMFADMLDKQDKTNELLEKLGMSNPPVPAASGMKRKITSKPRDDKMGDLPEDAQPSV